MTPRKLELRDRPAVEHLLTAKAPVSEIVAHSGRHRSGICHEIKSIGFVDEELPQVNGHDGVAEYERLDHVKSQEPFDDWDGDLMMLERATGKMNVASQVERNLARLHVRDCFCEVCKQLFKNIFFHLFLSGD